MSIYTAPLHSARAALFAFVALAPAAGRADVSTPPPAGEIYDIYGPLPLAEAPNWPLYLGTAALVAILAALALYYLRRKQAAPSREIQPQTMALAELALARRLLEENASIAYAARVADILRRYVEQRFTINSTSLTTREFLRTIESTGNTPNSPLYQHRRLLGSFLHQCDLAKYAGKAVGGSQLEEMEYTVRRFIEDTMEAQ